MLTNIIQGICREWTHSSSIHSSSSDAAAARCARSTRFSLGNTKGANLVVQVCLPLLPSHSVAFKIL